MESDKPSAALEILSSFLEEALKETRCTTTQKIFDDAKAFQRWTALP